MLKGEGNEDGKRINRSYRQKKYTLHLQHIFWTFFDVVSDDYNMKLRSYSLYVGNVVCAHQKLVAYVSVRFFFFFFQCRLFSPCWSLEFLIFSPPISMFYFQRNSPPLSNALALSLLSTSVKTFEIQSDLTLLLFFLSKTSGQQCEFPPKRPLPAALLHLGYRESPAIYTTTLLL